MVINVCMKYTISLKEPEGELPCTYVKQILLAAIKWFFICVTVPLKKIT